MSEDIAEKLQELTLRRRTRIPREQNASRVEEVPESASDLLSQKMTTTTSSSSSSSNPSVASEPKDWSLYGILEYVKTNGIPKSASLRGPSGPGDESAAYVALKLQPGPTQLVESITAELAIGPTRFASHHDARGLPGAEPETPDPVRLCIQERCVQLVRVRPTFFADRADARHCFSTWQYKVPAGEFTLDDLLERGCTIESRNNLMWTNTGGKLTLEPGMAAKIEGTDRDYYAACAPHENILYSSIVVFCVEDSGAIRTIHHLHGPLIKEELGMIGGLETVDGFFDDIKSTLKRRLNIDGLLAARNKSFRTTALSMPEDLLSLLESPTVEVLSDTGLQNRIDSFARTIRAVVNNDPLAPTMDLVRTPSPITADYLDKSSALNGASSKRNHPTVVRYLPRASKLDAKGVRIFEIPVDSHATMQFKTLYPKLAKSGNGDDFEDRAAEIFFALEFEADDHKKLFPGVPSVLRLQLDTSDVNVVRALASNSRAVFAGLQTIRQGDTTGATQSFVVIMEKVPTNDSPLGKIGSIYIVCPEV